MLAINAAHCACASETTLETAIQRGEGSIHG
jgi:hypothetical protein